MHKGVTGVGIPATCGILAGCPFGISFAKACLYDILHDVHARAVRPLRLRQFVDDLAQSSTRAELVASALFDRLVAAGFVISHNTLVGSTTSHLEKLRSETEASPVRTAKSVKDLGLDTTASARRCVPTQKKRVTKMEARAKRVHFLRRHTPKTRWMKVKGPIGATNAVLLDAGWRPVQPDAWMLPEPCDDHWPITAGHQQDLMDHFAQTLHASLWESASHFFEGACSEGGVNLSAAKALLKHCQNEGRHADCGLLSAICVGDLWRAARKHAQGVIADPTCPRCGQAPETLTHRHWQCEANSSILEPEENNTQSLCERAIAESETTPRTALIAHRCLGRKPHKRQTPVGQLQLQRRVRCLTSLLHNVALC